MTILVTGASGNLGALIIDALLDRGAAAGDIIATARSLDKLEGYATRGVATAVLDYDDASTIRSALEGVDRVALVSGSVPGARVEGHRRVIEAAKAAGVSQLVYTSAPRATTADFVLAPDHKATEEAIAAAELPAVVLRNNWYSENYLDDAKRAAETGVVAHAAGDGRVASASREDFAEAAAAVLLAELTEFNGRTIELAGDVAWTFDDFAAIVGELANREVRYERLSTEQLVAALEGAGLDAGTAGFVAAIDEGISRGVLDVEDHSLRDIIGRPTTPLADTLAAVI